MLSRLSGVCLCLLAVVVAAGKPSGAPANLLPASDSRYLYEGRFDRADPQQPVITWSGSRISVDFSGGKLTLVFGAVTDQCVFDVTVDGVTEIADIRTGKSLRYDWPRPLGSGRHHLEIFKRSEAAKGVAAFAGVELAPSATAWAPPVPDYRVKFEFFGDSITAGACNEDGAEDQWLDFRTHNHALSYGYLASRALAADHRAMAVSGMGVAIGWEPMLAGQVWDKLYPRPDSPRAELATWQPDVAFVNLGENDDSFATAHNLPFPAGYVPEYIALIKAIRAAYPRAQIVLLRGGMMGGAKSDNLRVAWEGAVRDVEAADPRIAHFVFSHWSSRHSRVADDRILAEELTAWLKQQPFMAPFLEPAR